VWLVYLDGPLGDLFDGRHTAAYVTAVLIPVVVFSGLYVWLACTNGWGPGAVPDQQVDRVKVGLLAGMAAIALVLPVVADPMWVLLWIYVSTSCGYSLPLGRLRMGPQLGLGLGLACGAVMAVQAVAMRVPTADWAAALVPTLISCIATVGVRRMQQLILELREARAEVARLAVTEERLRMARDLHDLAGHSLATITLKAELARKLMAVDPARAEQQMLDLEHVSRQALSDIREAVSGYRRATLAVEGASARTALAAAGIALDADPLLALRSGELTPDVEEALAWCLREAVTNVVRHSGARTCRIRLIEARVDGESTVTLEVLDDGSAGTALEPGAEPAAGNGLNGLRERLRAVSAQARLTAVSTPSAGFRLAATLPSAPRSGGTRVQGPSTEYLAAQ
jgi:two-component system sensor histidine kinase DesK